MLRYFTLAALLLTAPLHAQTRPDEEDVLVVTGTRSGEAVPAEQLGASVTVLSAEMLEARQVREIADVLRDVPGVAVSQTAGLTQIRVRGSEANHTLVLVDGIEAADPYLGEPDLGSYAADLGAKIEVLRGQQSALYGSDAIGGVVHYITLSGRDAPGLSGRVEAGSFETVNAAARAAGVTGPLDYALTGTLLATGGTPDARDGERDLGSTSGAVALKAGLEATDTLRFSAVGRLTWLDRDFNDQDFTPGSPSFGLVVDTPGARLENEARYALLRAELDLLGGRWRHAVSGQIADVTRDTFAFDDRTSGSTGQRLKGSYETSYLIEADAARHRLTAALDVERERFRNTEPASGGFTGRRQLETLGLVGQYELTVGDYAGFGASIRHDDNDRFGDTTTYRVQGSYRLGEGTRLHAAAGSGIKNPVLFELFGFFDGEFIGNPGLKPERSEGWEAGIEQSLLDGALTLGATWFDNRLKGEIFITFPPPDFISTPGNRDTDSRQQGLETTLAARFGRAWRVDASYTFLDAEENGVEEPRRPNHVASAAVSWLAPEDRGGVTLVARYNGEQEDLAFLDPSFVPTRVTLDDVLLLSLNASIALSPEIELFGRVENLLDEDYEEVFSFVSPGRAAYAGLRARF